MYILIWDYVGFIVTEMALYIELTIALTFGGRLNGFSNIWIWRSYWHKISSTSLL